MNANPFADDFRSDAILPASENPYSPPVLTRSGWWDKTLLRRIVKAWAFIAAWFVFMDAVIWVKFFGFSHGQTVHMSPVELVKSFFTDWAF